MPNLLVIPLYVNKYNGWNTVIAELMYHGHLRSDHKCPDSPGQLVYIEPQLYMYMQVCGLSRCPYSQLF